MQVTWARGQLDPDFVRKKSGLCVSKCESNFGIKEYVNDEEFQVHGRLIAPELFCTKTSKLSEPLLFKPGEATDPYPLCARTDHLLMMLKDDEERFLSPDKDGISFCARDGKLLHHLPVSEFCGRLVELSNHECRLLLQIGCELWVGYALGFMGIRPIGWVQAAMGTHCAA